MCKNHANYNVYINGQAVPVSEEVYRVYKHFERKRSISPMTSKQKNLVGKQHPFSQVGKTPMNVCWRQTSSL